MASITLPSGMLKTKSTYNNQFFYSIIIKIDHITNFSNDANFSKFRVYGGKIHDLNADNFLAAFKMTNIESKRQKS